MSRATRAAVAAQLLGGDVADGQQVASALERACERLRANLGPWIGDDGCTALLQRGLERARAEHPALVGIALRGEPPRLEGLDGLRGQPPGVALAAARAVITRVLHQLSRFVGEDVALRLVLAGDDPPPSRDPNEPADDDSGDAE